MRQFKPLLIAAVFVTAAVLNFADVSDAQSPPSPVGVWDITITGNVVGSAVIQFYADNSLGGYVLITPKGSGKSPNLPDPPAEGFTGVTGQWTVDVKGHLVGFVSGGSNDLPLDMSIAGVIKLSTIPTKPSTISFTGTGSDGIWHFRGTPAADLPPIADSWSALVRKDGVNFNEFFELIAFDICVDDPAPLDVSLCQVFLSGYIYNLDGSGPGYATEGMVMVNAGGRIGIALAELIIDKGTGIPADTGNIRSVTGKMKPTSFTVSGHDEEHLIIRMAGAVN